MWRRFSWCAAAYALLAPPWCSIGCGRDRACRFGGDPIGTDSWGADLENIACASPLSLRSRLCGAAHARLRQVRCPEGPRMKQPCGSVHPFADRLLQDNCSSLLSARSSACFERPHRVDADPAPEHPTKHLRRRGNPAVESVASESVHGWSAQLPLNPPQGRPSPPGNSVSRHASTSTPGRESRPGRANAATDLTFQTIMRSTHASTTPSKVLPRQGAPHEPSAPLRQRPQTATAPNIRAGAFYPEAFPPHPIAITSTIAQRSRLPTLLGAV